MLTAIEFLKGKNKICKKEKCIDCRLSADNNGTNLLCNEFIKTCPEKAIEIIEKWLKENPTKTNLEKFHEVFGENLEFNYCEVCQNQRNFDNVPCLSCGWWDEEYKGG